MLFVIDWRISKSFKVFKSFLRTHTRINADIKVHYNEDWYLDAFEERSSLALVSTNELKCLLLVGRLIKPVKNLIMYQEHLQK